MTFQPAVWPPEWPEIKQAVLELWESGKWGCYKSPHQEELRNRLRQRIGVQSVRLCGSGSSAIEIALRAANVQTGDGVIVAAFDYPGNFRAIEAVGAVPVLVDVDQNGVSLDPDLLDEKLLDASLLADAANANGAGCVRALIVSHLFGCAARMAAIRAWCDESEINLIEDACQVPGMMIDGRPAGSWGDLAAVSFGGSKPLTAGNGGAVLTNDRRLAARIASFLDRPSDSQPLSTLQAATLLPQLERLGDCNRIRCDTVRFLQDTVNHRLTSWKWLSELPLKANASDQAETTHYKVAWQCQSAEQRHAIVEAAVGLGLPIGASFRSLAKSSPRRCRKPVPLTRSAELGETAFVLDHSALLVDEMQHESLRDALLKLHDLTSA